MNLGCECFGPGSPLEGYDLNELRVFIGHNMPKRLLKAPKLLWVQWVGELMCEDCDLRYLDVKRAGPGDLSAVVVLNAPELASFMFPLRKRGLESAVWVFWMLGVAVAVERPNSLWKTAIGLFQRITGLMPGSLPEWFGNLTSLQVLDVSGLWLSGLPQSFGGLTALQTLYMLGCAWLSSLPETFGDLAALQELSLLGCERIVRLPESFGKLAALQELNLSECKRLVELPESFGNLAALQSLHMLGCEELTRLPASLAGLTALRMLHLSRNKRLTILPDDFCQLRALQVLSLRYCISLTSLPKSFGSLIGLQQVQLTYCTKLASLPSSFGNLTGLQELCLSGCDKLSVPAELVQAQIIFCGAGGRVSRKSATCNGCADQDQHATEGDWWDNAE